MALARAEDLDGGLWILKDEPVRQQLRHAPGARDIATLQAVGVMQANDALSLSDARSQGK